MLKNMLGRKSLLPQGRSGFKLIAASNSKTGIGSPPAREEWI